jgi:ribosomal protein L16 Arg81 hydroxylase
MAECLHIAPRMNFQEFIAPIDIDRFLADIWQRRPLYIPGDRQKLAGLFDRAAFEVAIRAAPDGGGLIKVARRASDGTHREIPVSYRQVQDLFALGFTICVAHIDMLDARVGALAAALKRELLCSGFVSVNCYYSPDKHGFGTHFDNHPVLIAQIAGAKRWRFSSRPAVEWPTEPMFPGTISDAMLAPWNRSQPPDEAAFEEVLLSPGDVLYLPAGTWHRAAADASSIALTVAFPHATVFDLVSYALSRIALPKESWRQDLPLVRAKADAPEAPAEVLHAISKAVGQLQELAAALTPGDVLRHWYRIALSRAVDRPPARSGPRTLGRDDMVAIPDEVLLRYFVAEGGGRRMLHVFGGGTEITLPAEALPLLQGIARARSFTVAEATSWLPAAPFEAVVKLLSGLIDAGILR